MDISNRKKCLLKQQIKDLKLYLENHLPGLKEEDHDETLPDGWKSIDPDPTMTRLKGWNDKDNLPRGNFQIKAKSKKNLQKVPHGHQNLVKSLAPP